jgi:cobalt-precorrin-5B (C1)-methyltransferase
MGEEEREEGGPKEAGQKEKMPEERGRKGGVRDPVAGLSIPRDWIERSADPRVLEKVRSGLWALLSDGTLLRRGLTTGTTAAAAAKGAVISLGGPVFTVSILTPAGIRVSVPVEGRRGTCTAVKIGGDHASDVTAGAALMARAEAIGAEAGYEAAAGEDPGPMRSDDTRHAEGTGPGGEGPGKRIELVAGAGIGRIGAAGLTVPLGKPAISPSARGEIETAIEEGMEEAGLEAVRVELEVINGEAIARETLNPKVGVLGGISILGSTGFVEPWNEHLAESRETEVLEADRVVVTTGRVGLRYSRFLFPKYRVVLLGNQLDRLRFREGQDSVLCGLPALILKWGMPELLEGTGYRTVAEMVEEEPGHPRIDEALQMVGERLPGTRIVLINRDGSILRELPPPHPPSVPPGSRGPAPPVKKSGEERIN